MSENWLELSVTELAPRIKSGEVSPVELTKAVLDHAEARNKEINAYITFMREEALKEAQKAEDEIASGNYKGVFHGMPIAIKDNIYVKGVKATMASKIHADFVPDYDAAVIEKLRKAGAIIIGKLNMHEYAWGATSASPHFGPVHNPWNKQKISGGSSGGSSAAIAMDMAFATLGTDTGGSIRIPSSMCGSVGLKPTYGRVSNYGSFPLAWTLDHIGPITKTVKDAAAMLEIIAGQDDRDTNTASVDIETYLEKVTGNVEGVVIGIEEDFFFKNVDAETEKVVRKQIDALEKAGATIKKIKMPAMDNAEWATMITILTEPAALHQKNHMERPQDFGPDLLFLFALGEMPSGVDYVHAQQIRQHLKEEFRQVFEEVDVLISPTMPIATPNIGDLTIDLNGTEVELMDHFIRFTGAGDITGLPALSVPAGFRDGMPVGIQIMGAAFDEATILNVGYAIEKNNPTEGKKPY